MLNSEQLQVKEKILDFINNSNDSFYLLNGAAGTGKTYTISSIISHLQSNDNRLYIAGLAPTHKAVKVLRESSLCLKNHNVDYMTVHQCLGLHLTSKEDKHILEIGDNKIRDYELIIIDECSMIGKDLWVLIKKIAKKSPNKKFILLGDKAQLNPINENISPVFLEVKNQSELTQNIRTGTNNPIMFNINLAREKVFNPNLSNSFNLDKIDKNSKGTWIMKHDQWLQAMAKAFKSPNYENNCNYVKAIAWRNNTVDYINSFVRNSLYDTNEPYTIGDKLIAKEAIFNPYDLDEMLLPNNSEFQILKTEQSTFDSYDTIWLTVFCHEEDMQCRIPVLHPNAIKNYYNDLRKIGYDTKQAKNPDWSLYWELKTKFAKINYGYAITAHKAQGSTYDNVFIHEHDIISNPNQIEANRCLYVSFSRAKERIFLR